MLHHVLMIHWRRISIWLANSKLSFTIFIDFTSPHIQREGIRFCITRTVKGLFGGITGVINVGKGDILLLTRLKKYCSVISQYFISVFLLYWFGTNLLMQDPHLSFCFSSLTPHLCPVDGSKATQRREGYKKARWKFFHTMSGTLEAPPLLDRSFKLSSIKLP